jgi:hypothetical protein
MNCQEIENELSAYIDGELPAKLRSAVDEHLKTCVHCRRRVAEMRQLTAGIAALPKQQVPAEFLSAVRRKIARGEEPGPIPWQEMLFRSLWLRVALGSAMFLGLVLLTTDFLRPVWTRRADVKMAKAEAEPKKSAPPAPYEDRPAKPSAPETRPSTVPVASPASRALGATEPVRTKVVEAPAAQLAPTPARQPASVRQPAADRIAPPVYSLGEVRSETVKLADEREVGLEVRKSREFVAQTTGGKGSLAGERVIASNNVTVLYLNESPPAITAEADDPVELETQVNSLATSLQGQIIGQDNTQTNMRKLYVMLPVGSVEEFKAQFARADLLSRQRRNQARAQNVNALSLTVQTGVAQTKSNQDLLRMAPATPQTQVIIKPRGVPSVEQPSAIVLEIQVVPPKN